MKKKKKEFNLFWETPFEKEPFKNFFEPVELKFTVPRPKFPRQGIMPVNMADSGDKIIIRAALPGFKKDEISLNVTGHTIEISAAKKHEKISKTERTFHQERAAKMMNRSFTLPEMVDPDHTEAKLEDGLLIISLKKLRPEEKKKKKIEIR